MTLSKKILGWITLCLWLPLLVIGLQLMFGPQQTSGNLALLTTPLAIIFFIPYIILKSKNTHTTIRKLFGFLATVSLLPQAVNGLLVLDKTSHYFWILLVVGTVFLIAYWIKK